VACFYSATLAWNPTAVDNAVTTIHVEPENKAKHSGVLVL
jgi:hypothetical protein